MKTYFADQAVSITIPLTRDGEPFVPDDGTLDWEVRDHTGAVAQDRVTLTGIVDSQVSVTIGSYLSSIDPSRQFEKRTVVVYTNSVGQPQVIRSPYRLTKWLNFTACPADVRTFIGVDDGELADTEVDLLTAYYDLTGLMDVGTLNTALNTGTSVELQANKALVAQAVLNVLPSLQARISKTTTDGPNTITRFGQDINVLREAAQDTLDKAITAITARDTSARGIGFLIGTDRTDPVTNT